MQTVQYERATFIKGGSIAISIPGHIAKLLKASPPETLIFTVTPRGIVKLAATK